MARKQMTDAQLSKGINKLINWVNRDLDPLMWDIDLNDPRRAAIKAEREKAEAGIIERNRVKHEANIARHAAAYAEVEAKLTDPEFRKEVVAEIMLNTGCSEQEALRRTAIKATLLAQAQAYDLI